MDEKQAKRKRNELRQAKRWQMENDRYFGNSRRRKEIVKSFKTAFRAVKRSERNEYKQNIKKEFGV